jgi:hypothetical protein
MIGKGLDDERWSLQDDLEVYRELFPNANGSSN